MMEEIKVFHSFRKNALMLLGCAAFAVAALFLLVNGKNSWICWLSLIFFGGGAIFFCFIFLRERLTGKAYLVISDQSLSINTVKERIVQFANVASFVVGESWIYINYKKGKGPDSQVRIFKNYFIDFGDGFLSNDLTMKQEDICTILNNRLRAI